MADKNIKLILELEKGGATASLKNFEGDLIKSGVAVKDLRGHFGNFILSTKKARAEVKLTSKELGQLEKTVGGFQNASGGAAASAMELGRVISDAPYGIRGMANNITQLVSQLGYQAAATNTATGATVGFGGALKAMWASLMGPLGVVFAITTVVSALDFFSGGAKSAKEETQDLTKSLDELLGRLGDIEGKVPQTIEALFEKLGLETNAFDEFAKNMSETVKILVNEFPEFKKAYESLSNTQKKDPKVISGLITKYRDLINVRKDIKYQEEKLKELNKANGEYAESNLKLGRKVYKDLLLRKIALEDELKLKEKNSKIKVKKTEVKSPLFKTKKELDLAVKEQEQALLSLNKKLELQNIKNKEKEELLGAKTEQEKAKIKRKYAQQQLEKNISYEKKRLMLAMSTERQVAKAKYDEHVATLKRNLIEYEDRIRKSKLPTEKQDELIGNAQGETAKLLSQAFDELGTTNKGIDEAYKPVFEMFEKLAKSRRDALGIFDDGDDGSSKEFNKLAHYVDMYKEVVSGVGDFISAQYDRRLTIEQNHTNQLNEELNNRLLNENLSVSERKNIQNQIARNDEELRKKQNDIKRKAFNSQKAFNIASALTSTYLNAVKAEASQYAIPTPDAPFRAKAAKVAAIASGLLSVAAIASQKFQPDAASTPIRTASGGGAGGGSSRTFDFNLVGSSQNNQIADAIGGQFNKPLKAYVVSKDITNQQQLDANTKSAARFGG